MNTQKLFQAFSNKKIIVLGDIMIDAYVEGSVSRISPEAPVPIISLEQNEKRLGGAANVALNLLSLGAQPIICSIIGNDDGGKSFLDLLREKGMTTDGVLVDNQRKTTVKTRLIGNNQHLLRIDDEQTNAISEEQETKILAKIFELIDNGVDAIILEDYNKGVLTKKVIRKTIDYANKKDVPTTVDPKKENFWEYKNATLFKPNLKELKEGVNIDFSFPKEKEKFEKAVAQLEKQLNNKISFVTLSEYGVFIKDNDRKSYIPAHIRNIADVSGAGDTVISVATLCLTIGLPIDKIAAIANLAGGLVCEQVGVVPITKELLQKEIEQL